MKISEIARDKWFICSYHDDYGKRIVFRGKSSGHYSCWLKVYYDSFNAALAVIAGDEYVISTNSFIHDIKCKQSGNFIKEGDDYSDSLDRFVENWIK